MEPRQRGVYLAKHPVADKLMAEYPTTLIRTSGFDVGLPEGTMGNSEVGHQNIAPDASSIRNPSASPRNTTSRSGHFFDNVELNNAVTNSLINQSDLHLFGIVSDAGVHGLLEHLFGCLELCKRRGSRACFCMRSPTAATRRRAMGSTTFARSKRR